MRFASFANVAPLHIYHLKNGQVQKAVDFASSTWGRVSLKVALVLRTHGYMPIGVLIWFAIWSVGSSYYDTRGWTTGYYGKRRLAGVIAVLAGFHFLFRFLFYVVLAENGQISWSGVFAVVAIMLIPNFLLVIRSVDTAQLYSLLVRWMYEHVIMRSYRDPVSLVAVLVFHNSRASLQQAWDRVLAEIRSAPLRTQLRDEVTLALEQAPSPLEARVSMPGCSYNGCRGHNSSSKDWFPRALKTRIASRISRGRSRRPHVYFWHIRSALKTWIATSGSDSRTSRQTSRGNTKVSSLQATSRTSDPLCACAWPSLASNSDRH